MKWLSSYQLIILRYCRYQIHADRKIQKKKKKKKKKKDNRPKKNQIKWIHLDATLNLSQQNNKITKMERLIFYLFVKSSSKCIEQINI